MVVFTCAHCGESVKKNQVEKHHTITRCRNVSPSLTCVDCLKDFNGNEFAAHTSCVTEEERYSAKGFVSKAPSDKGKKRQESWLEFIKRILDSSERLDVQVRNLLERIAPDPGVPQKKPKFLNFCKNKFKYSYNQTVYERTWEFLEKKRAEMRNSSATENNSQNNESYDGQEDRKRKRIDSSNDNSTDSTENKTNDSSKHNNETLGKKKKKQKQDTDSVQSCDVQERMGEADSKKKKKKSKSQNSCIQNGVVSVADEENEDNCIETKHKDEAPAVQETDNGGNEEHEQANHLSKKEKKEKRKKEKYERQLLEILNQPDEEQQVNNNVNIEVLEKRKKKKKHQENGAIENLEQEAVKTNSRKKQELLDADFNTVENGEGNEEHVEEDIDVKPSKFNWEETVVKLLESKGELPLKRVEKKIVNEYMNSGAHVDSIEKVIAKFNKKILKMSRVKVKKEVVKLVS